jgi:hypothetical protein
MMNQAFKCVMQLTKKYNIDESHSLKHSMEVMKLSEDTYGSEVRQNYHLKTQKNVIIAAAVLHDMCDRKYVTDESVALAEIRGFMSGFLSETEMNAVINIITTMSYSKVKKSGYPELGEYQLAYHIVREADLLAAYDIDRCTIFAMNVHNMEYGEALERARALFDERVMTYYSDGLFVTDYSKRKAYELHSKCLAERVSVEWTCNCKKIECSGCSDTKFWNGRNSSALQNCTNRGCVNFTCRCNKFACGYCNQAQIGCDGCNL